jgi:hypothetical protein
MTLQSGEYCIPYQAAESITLAILKDHHRMLSEQLNNHYEGKNLLHKKDVGNTHKQITCLDTLIEYFGG